MASASEPELPHNPDQDLPSRRGEKIDDDRDKKPERDKVPDRPPTEPDPVPIKEPPTARTSSSPRPGRRVHYMSGLRGRVADRHG